MTRKADRKSFFVAFTAPTAKKRGRGKNAAGLILQGFRRFSRRSWTTLVAPQQNFKDSQNSVAAMQHVAFLANNETRDTRKFYTGYIKGTKRLKRGG